MIKSTQTPRPLLHLAIRLSQEAEGRCRTMAELADDALALFEAGQRVKSGDAARAMRKAAKVAAIYDARVVQNEDAALALRFTSGHYSPLFVVA